MSNEEKFEAIRRRYLALEAKKEEFRDKIGQRYGYSFDRSWLSVTERTKLQSFHDRLDKISDDFYALLDEISPRSWRDGIASYWVVTELTYSDATTRGELSTMPTGGYGASAQFLRDFVRPLSSRDPVPAGWDHT